jgi:undecaprenyl-diphosphatase
MDALIIFCAKYLYLFCIILFFFVLWRLEAKKRLSFVLLSLFSFPIALVVGKILNHFIQDPRPFVVEHVKPLIEHAPDNGFPSDHTLLTMTIAAVVFAYNKKLGVVLFVLALFVGGSRVLAKIHHPLDIAGSTLIAIVATWVIYLLLRLVQTKRTTPQEK